MAGFASTASRRRRSRDAQQKLADPMKRFIPQHFNLNGRPKKPLTEERARQLALRQHKNPYRCKFCKQWHIGGRA